MSVKKTQDPIIVTPPKPLPIPSPTYSLEEGQQGTSEAEVVTEPKARFVGATHAEIHEWPGPYHVTENGLYECAGYEFSTNLLVEVAPKGLTEITIDENGVYKPSDYDGYSKVTVSVQPILEELEVTENGEYLPTSPTQGFSKVTVLVEPPLVVDPVLANNSWEVIRQVCEAGEAANYWAVGDVKNETGPDGYTRPVMIVDMSHGRTVFMFRNRTETGYIWQPTAIDGYYNNYSVSQMRTTHLAVGGGVRSELIGSDLAAQLTASSYKVATNGNDGTLLTLSDQLWLPAEKELTATRVYSRQDEFDALDTFDYFVANDTNTARKSPKASAPTATSGNIYWERSPYTGNAFGVCGVGSGGGLVSDGASSSYGVAPCFAW